MEKNYDLVVLIAMFLCGSSFANDEYFSCDTAKGIIKLDVNKDELQYTLTKGRKSEFTYESKGNDFSGFKYNHYSRFQTDYLNVSLRHVQPHDARQSHVGALYQNDGYSQLYRLQQRHLQPPLS